ncbi:hypothetical protein SARC_07975 [Sphaeroforma arctica JP610]|uniref:Uncharacterized protein n=1 Tax=Sphaeroforma arctica JP610 TaxID=667725 RepID=A0A0L0FSG2_9EUKA|nr:hypothetical protein SARC_07975 [Sphaeroforma arctica JP610]KNC79639.1 hypothetical protein SARC_07975 [Sphaeroforma arctica JP610]|eukprot:XP_014153541.1 hypothetical protein SARC_07975 [Sphaeroforma arctica JP610]
MRLEIDKSVCQGNHVLVSRFVSKLEQTAPVPISTLHKMRVGVHNQQPERRMPLVDAELRRQYEQAINDCGDDEEDNRIQISLYISELELMRSRLGDQINEPSLTKLLKTSEFPKVPKDSFFRLENCEDIIEFTTQSSDLFLATSMPLCQYPALVRRLLDSTDATEKTKAVLNNIRDSETQTTRHFTDPESHPVDYLLEKFLNAMQYKKMNVEVRTERVHKTMAMLEERYRNSDNEPVNFQILKVQRYLALKYYGLQSVVDLRIQGNKQPDGSEGHLSDIEHTKFHTMTETHIRTASVTQRERMLRDQARAANKRNNTQTNTQVENKSTNANKRRKTDNGAHNQNRQRGQTQKKKGAREERTCPYCQVMPSPHRYSECPEKKANQAKKA